MASKTLIRTGASVMNRMFLSNPILHQNPNVNAQFVSHSFEITPQLFPTLSKLQTSLHLPQNDAHSVTRLSKEEFFHPCGLPSLRFFLPDGDSSEPMLLFPKRTFQPSLIRRKRNHGFFARRQLQLKIQKSRCPMQCKFCLTMLNFYGDDSCCASCRTSKATKGGRRVIARRIAKGRSRITA